MTELSRQKSSSKKSLTLALATLALSVPALLELRSSGGQPARGEVTGTSQTNDDFGSARLSGRAEFAIAPETKSDSPEQLSVEQQRSLLKKMLLEIQNGSQETKLKVVKHKEIFEGLFEGFVSEEQEELYRKIWALVGDDPKFFVGWMAYKALFDKEGQEFFQEHQILSSILKGIPEELRSGDLFESVFGEHGLDCCRPPVECNPLDTIESMLDQLSISIDSLQSDIDLTDDLNSQELERLLEKAKYFREIEKALSEGYWRYTGISRIDSLSKFFDLAIAAVGRLDKEPAEDRVEFVDLEAAAHQALEALYFGEIGNLPGVLAGVDLTEIARAFYLNPLIASISKWHPNEAEFILGDNFTARDLESADSELADRAASKAIAFMVRLPVLQAFPDEERHYFHEDEGLVSAQYAPGVVSLYMQAVVVNRYLPGIARGFNKELERESDILNELPFLALPDQSLSDQARSQQFTRMLWNFASDLSSRALNQR